MDRQPAAPDRRPARNAAVLQPLRWHGLGMIVHVPQRKCAEAGRQRISLVVVGNPQGALKLNRESGAGMHVGKRENKAVVLQLDHGRLLLVFYQLPSRTSRTKRK